MSERITVATSFIYNEPVRKQVREILVKAGVRMSAESETVDGMEDIGPLYGWAKPGSSPGIELLEFVGWDEELLKELDTTTGMHYRSFHWWLVLIGDGGDYVHVYRFQQGTHQKMDVRPTGSCTFTEQPTGLAPYVLEDERTKK